MRKESKPSVWSVLLFVLLLGIGLSLLILWRIHAFDRWLYATFPHFYPAALGALSLALAMKIAFRPSSWDVERGFRWLWVPLFLFGAVMLFGRAFS